ncbi:MAG: HAD-IIB family hydrolase [Candidatus Levybacteria bacterium]|nr:HAD-IIB family hydrolase [Candidatus Levybacteria bacterium]
MVKAIILDVDGVIVGDKQGVNFPLPAAEVIQKLKEIHKRGIPIILCTAKFGFAILEIIKQAELNNPHITDGGALITNPLEHKIIKTHVIKKHIVKKLSALFIKENIYLEIYTPKNYYVQESQVSNFTKKRTDLLQKEPILVTSLHAIAEKGQIIKLISFTRNDDDIPRIEKILRQFNNMITFIWSSHPYIAPARPGIITAPNVSKEHAAKEAIESLALSFDEVLGVGDGASDWKFMQLCKYAATLENADKQIKALVKTKGEGNYIIAPHINDNGILSIFRYFSL